MSETPATTAFSYGDGERRAGEWRHTTGGSMYEYISVASFALGADGTVEQWSSRAEELFGVPASEILGKDPVEEFVPARLRTRGHRRMAEILDGSEWTGLVPFRAPHADGGARSGMAEIYVMPTRTDDGRRGAVCIVVDVRKLRRIESDLAASQAIFGESPFGFLLFGTDLKVRRTNDRLASAFGGQPDTQRGRTAHDYLPKNEADRVETMLQRVLDTGESLTDIQVVGPDPGTGERRQWSLNLFRVHTPNGRPLGVAGLGVDVTRRHAAAREAAHARRNLALLNEAGARIGNSLDLETTARELLDVAVPGFCDVATVDLFQSLLLGEESHSEGAAGQGIAGARMRRVGLASAVADSPVTEAEEPVSVGSVHRYPADSAAAEALRSARPQLVSMAGPGLVQSRLVVPMTAHDTVVGVVQFARAKGSEPFNERDRSLASELAARAAVCIDNARLYRREHERALLLQRSLLPPGDPEASGLDIACRYMPGSEAAEVGGDWFDVIELPGHRTALVVGDVMGRGLRAAVAMGELRSAVRTLAMLDLEPAEVLTTLDEIAQGLGTPSTSAVPGARRTRSNARRTAEDGLAEVYLATCVYAVYDPVTRRCIIANAGHLPPVLVEPGQASTMLDVPPGLPLGVGGEPFEDIEIELPEGAVLALYTDGLVESRDHSLEEGLAALCVTLDTSAVGNRRVPPSAPSAPSAESDESVESADAAPEREQPTASAHTEGEAGDGRGASLEDVCDHVLTGLDTHHGEDDIALLMARIAGLPAGSVGDWTLSSEPRSVSRAREVAREQLESWQLGALIDTTELLVSELVTNALRYGEGDIRLRLLLDRTLVCEVWDAKLVQPRRRRARDTDEGGRGLQLVQLLSSAWGSRRTHLGKTVWFELELPGEGGGAPDPTEALLSLF